MSARDGGGSRPSKVEKERGKKNYDPNVFFLSQVNAAIKRQRPLGEWNRARAFSGCCFRPRVLVQFDALTVQIEWLGAYF